MITAFQKNAFQNNAFQIDVTPASTSQDVGGTIIATSGANYTRKRFRELMAELRAEAEAKGLKARKQAVKAQQAIQRANFDAEEAISDRLVREEEAHQLATLLTAARAAQQTADALAYARQVKDLIERLRDQAQEEDELFALGIF